MRNTPVEIVALIALLGCGSSLHPLEPLLVGTWGGDNAGLIATDSSAHIHIGCTVGDVHQPLVVDSSGRFDVLGIHNITAYPVYRGPDHPARFSGRIVGRVMSLTVTLTDTAVTLGPVLLRFGEEPRMGPCPICRTPKAATLSRHLLGSALPSLGIRTRALELVGLHSAAER